MSFVKYLGAAITAVALVAATAGIARADALDDIISNGTIRVAIDTAAAPFGFMNADNQPDGADVAAAKLLAKDLGVKLQIVPTNSANRIAYLTSGRVDLTMSSFSLSPERAKAVAFSSPYGVIRSIIMAPHDLKIDSPADLVGKKISVARGTTNETDAVAIAPEGADVIRFDDEASAISAVVSGQADAYATGEPLGAPLIKRFPDKHFEAKLVLRNNYYCVGMKRDEVGLMQWVNVWVFYRLHDGTLGKIYKQYVGADLPDNIPSL